MMLNIPSQYMYHCVILLCYCVSRARDHCCVLCEATQNLPFTLYSVHQPPCAMFLLVNFGRTGAHRAYRLSHNNNASCVDASKPDVKEILMFESSLTKDQKI